jgi:amino acid transporter
MSDTSHDTESGRVKKAGAFDVRTIIGALLGIYGLVLTLMGVFGETGESKTGGVNANLWAGLALLAVGIFFLAWARLRPIVVAETPDEGEKEELKRPAPH